MGDPPLDGDRVEPLHDVSDATDDENDGRPDAPVNPTPNNDDEWYPAIMTELTYMLLENRPPVRFPDADDIDDSAPRPACGRPGRTQMVFRFVLTTSPDSWRGPDLV